MRRPAGSPTKSAAMPSTPMTTGVAILHKIAPGEIALLHVGESHVETAANIDGKLVLKKHPRPT